MMKLAPLMLLLTVCGCHARPRPDTAEGFPSKPARLEGVYGVAHTGTVEPVLRVAAVKDGYQFEERTTGEWKPDPQMPHTATEAEVVKSLGGLPAKPVFGLATDSVYLLKVEPGWSGNGVTTKSGFLLISQGKLAPAEKIELGGR